MARNRIFPEGRAKHTMVADLIDAITKLGKKPAKRLQSLRGIPVDRIRLPFDAILKCNYRASTDAWHWVVWDAKAKKARDPARPSDRYKKLRVHSYLRVD